MATPGTTSRVGRRTRGPLPVSEISLPPQSRPEAQGWVPSNRSPVVPEYRVGRVIPDRDVRWHQKWWVHGCDPAIRKDDVPMVGRVGWKGHLQE